MTRKAPSGARHASCLDHIEYGAATKSGWLCITTNTENVAWPPLEIPRPDAGAEGPFIPRGVVGRDMQPVDRAADMRAFADHIATVAAAAHARELARRDIPADPKGGWLATTDAKTGKAGRVAPPTQYGGHLAPRAADVAAINALAAELDARKGRAVKVAPVDTYVAAVKVAKARKAAPVKTEPVHVDLAPAPVTLYGVAVSAGHLGYSWTLEGGIVEVFQVGSGVCRATLASPIMSDGSRSGREWWPIGDRYAELWQPLTFATIGDAETARAAADAPEPGQRNDDGEPDARGTAAAHDFGDLCECGECVQPGTPDPVEPEPVRPCLYTAPPLNEACIAGPMGHKGAHEYPTVRPCDYYLHTVGVEPIRCTAGLVGHAGEHDYPAPVVAPEPIAEPIAAPAPVLAAVQPVTRPTCPRCGQVFRMKGAGLAWHLANRPDCAPARLSVAV